MKAILFPLLAGFFAAPSAFADWIMVLKSTTDGQVQEVKIQIKGDKTRLDAGEQMTLIANGGDSGGIVMLMHAQRMMMKLDPEKMKSMRALAGAALGGSDKPAAKPVATGQKEKVGDYDCEIFNWSGPTGIGKYWVASDFKGYKEMAAAQDKMMRAMGNPAAAFAPQAGDFPGMVIQSEMTLMGKSNFSELVSAKEEAVDDSVFTIPEGYNEIKMPGPPAGK